MKEVLKHLDKAFENRIRLGIMSALAVNDSGHGPPAASRFKASASTTSGLSVRISAFSQLRDCLL